MTSVKQDGKLTLDLNTEGKKFEDVDCLLWAIGRIPNTDNLNLEKTVRSMRGSRKFYQRGSNFDIFFFLMSDPNTTISGPLSVRQQNGARKFIRGVPTLTFFLLFFLVHEGREDPNTTISQPLSARKQNAIKWRFAGVLMMAQH